MPDYKEMYYTLFRALAKAKEIIEEAEQKTEDIFMESKEPIELVDFKDNKSDNSDTE